MLYRGRLPGIKKPPAGGSSARHRLFAAIDTATGAGLMDTNCTEFRQQGFELSPDPLGQHFAGRVFQAWDVIEVVVVEAFIERLENRLDLREVANPAGMGIQVAAKMDRHFERMPVQAPAFVAFRYVGQAVGGLEGKLFEDFHGVTCRACVAWV